MGKKTVRILLALLCGVLITGAASGENIKVYFFHQTGCSNCQTMEHFLESLKESVGNLEIVPLNLTMDMLANIQYEIAVRQLGIKSAAVPVVLIGEYYWQGSRPEVLENIAHVVAGYKAKPYRDLVGQLINGDIKDPSGIQSPALDSISLPFIGELSLSGYSLAASTALIAFVDGFNPCSLWVLTLVLGMALHAKKRSRVLMVGLLFLIITAGVYGAFLYGLLKVVAILEFSLLFKIILVAFIGLFAAVNIKDYFAFKQGLSFTISDQGKSTLAGKLRTLIDPSRGILALLAGTALLAFSAAVIELPCTAGFPVLWAQITAQFNLTRTGLWSYLALYLLVYLLDEIIILALVVLTLKRSFVDERKGRFLKLVSGSLMAVLTIHLVALPDLLRTVPGLASVILSTIVLIVLLSWIQKRRSAAAEAKGDAASGSRKKSGGRQTSRRR